MLINIINYLILFFKKIFGDWGLGIGDWGLGIGGWGPKPKHKTHKPKPQNPKIIIF